ncbi:DUF4838 domain-containing protein [Brumimicrobium oceani]|nr:DUF4838 domain-containing protein [Brumimicrobium oceani]
MTSTFSCSAKNNLGLKAEKYVIYASANQDSKYLAQIALDQLQKHTNQKDIISLINDNEIKNNKQKYIQFLVEQSAKDDYCIVHDSDKLIITVRKKADGIWMIHQLIEEIGKTDNRFSTIDLPPSTIKFITQCENFDFDYRDPHYSNNLIPGNALILGNNNVDLDWGIWGHNIKKVIGEINDSTIFALIDEKRVKEQFSFSSPVLLEHLTQYILNYFGNGDEKAYHFMIMPRDNNLVCLCEECKKLGNTKNNATPAVTYFIQKMAARFPKHQFFTSSYNSTKAIPKDTLRENTGAFLSTILLKKGVELNLKQAKTAKFVEELKAWRDITPNIYVWDYSANFDDYLTPIPVLYSLQKQLQFYKSQEVKGVFLNASGYDYSTFGDLKSFVSGALLKNTNADIDQLCTSFFQKYYPKNHQLLSNYYLSLEKSFALKNQSYNLYGGFDEITNTYLDTEAFLEFYNALEKVLRQTTGAEKERLLMLYTALSYTKLQIAYHQVTGKNGCMTIDEFELKLNPAINQTIEILNNSSRYSDLNKYKEAHGEIQQYIDFWKNEIINQKLENEIIQEKITILSAPDSEFENSKKLNNGLPGYSKDYHQGWYISSKDLKIEFPTNKISGTKKMKFRFLNNERHGFYPPEKIEIWSKDILLKTINNFDSSSALESVEFNLTLDLTNTDKVKVLFFRKSLSNSKIAIDEVRVLN